MLVYGSWLGMDIVMQLFFRPSLQDMAAGLG